MIKVAIVAGAIANWVMLGFAFSLWFELTKNTTSNPTLHAALWAFGTMAVFAGVALTPVGEGVFRLLNGCRRPIREEEEKFKSAFDVVCESARINSAEYELFISDDKFPNAFAMGRKTVCVTRTLLNGVPEEALQGVLAHELAHHVHGDAVRSIVFYMITLIGQIIMWGGWLVTKILGLFAAIGRQGNRSDDPAAIFLIFAKIFGALMWLFQLFVWIPIYAGACFGSRQQEYRADRYAAEIGYSEGLLSFLSSILDLDGHPSGFMGLLYRTHPSTGKRIKAIEDYDRATGKPTASAVG